MLRKQTIRDVDVDGKRVLVRVDFNVPLDRETGQVADDLRIRAAVPTIRYLRDHGAKTILISHLGRPKGVDESLRLAPVAERLTQVLGAPVRYVPEVVGPEVQRAAHGLTPGDVLLLENLRFHPGEERNDPELAKALASLAELYVNDAFGAAHRAHASTEGVAHYLPAVAGFLMEREIEYLSRAVSDPERPYAVITGGAKISGKIDVIRNLLDKMDRLLIGGGMANTFLKARGVQVGDSLVEDDQLATAESIAEEAARRGVTLQLPVDVVIADRFEDGAERRTVRAEEGVPPGWRIMDIGPATVEAFRAHLRDARTVVWNGPMGVFELPSFAEGTRAVARLLAGLDAVTIVGGGETAQAVEETGVADRISHVSTGGGASLEFLEGKALPGIAVLRDREA
ncbi:MAG TPA: phosphoglycerate kinase [Dehalococcoidia bacterium]